MSEPPRRVRLVRLSAPRRELVRRGCALLEDALHTASIPAGDFGRLLLVRRLDVGVIHAERSPAVLATAVEERLRALAAHAVHAESPAAAAHPAVYFRDEVEPLVLLAVRLARRQPVDAWFWRAALPRWKPEEERGQALRQLVYAASATRPGAAAVVALVRELREQSVLDALLSALAPADGASLLRACGWPLPPASSTRGLVAASPPGAAEARAALSFHLPPRWAPTLARWASRWGARDARSCWLATVALADEVPARLLDPTLPPQARRMVEHLAAGAPGAAPAAPRDAPPPEAGEAQPAGGATPRPDLSSASAAAAPEQAVAADDAPLRTRCAGLLFLVPVLARLGLAEHLRAHPGLAGEDLAGRLLHHVARRLRVSPDDPLVRLFAPPTPALPEVATELGAWSRAARRWCRRHAGLGLAALVLRPGRIAATRTHLDLFLDLGSADIRIRRAGLDLDPGWVPWLGRVVLFHYLPGEVSDAR